MAKGLFVQEGRTLDYTNGGAAAIAYCDVVALTSRIGIAESDIAVGALGAVSVTGVYELPAIATAAFTMGQALYWDGSAVTNAEDDGEETPTAYTPCGFAAAAKAQTAAAVLVKIG